MDSRTGRAVFHTRSTPEHVEPFEVDHGRDGVNACTNVPTTNVGDAVSLANDQETRLAVGLARDVVQAAAERPSLRRARRGDGGLGNMGGTTGGG